MNKEKPIAIELVGGMVWDPIRARALRGLSADEQRTADAILTAMHNRCVGVTPLLAANLASIFHHSRIQSETSGPWERVLRRLCDALSSNRETRRFSDDAGGRRAFGLMLKSNPLYTVFRLAMPVIEYACGRVGESMVFCEDAEIRGVDRNRYQAYAAAIHEKIMEIADDPENRHGALELFWKAKAASLSSFSRAPMVSDHRTPAPPEEDAIALSFLFRLEPKTPALAERSRRHKKQTAPDSIRYSRKRKEGGVVGVHYTRREEDLDAVLLSEFINDEVILLDHLVNSGYFAIQRKPKRDKKRDVLIAGMIPGAFRETLRADFIRACWFEFLMRLSAHLRAHGLVKSEFRWIEGNRLGGFRSCASLLGETPALEGAPRERIGKAWRQFFLTATRWLPSFVNARDRFTPAAGDMERPAPDSGEHVVETQKKWAFAAWKRQKENESWEAFDPARPNGRAPGEQRLTIHRFSFVHIMLFLSEKHRGPFMKSNAPGLENLVGGFGLGDFPGGRVSVTWVPEKLEEAHRWVFQAQGPPGAPLFPPEGRRPGAREISGGLVTAWLSRLMKEI